MTYERLTVKDIRTGKCERVGDPTTSAVYYINDRSGRFSLDEEVKTNRISFKEAYNRLAELEDLIEAGLLLQKMCKEGNEVYIIAKQGLDIYSAEKVIIVDFWYSKQDKCLYAIDSDGALHREVYATEQEAEAKLKELKNK